jgi:hypothetical protein
MNNQPEVFTADDRVAVSFYSTPVRFGERGVLPQFVQLGRAYVGFHGLVSGRVATLKPHLSSVVWLPDPLTVLPERERYWQQLLRRHGDAAQTGTDATVEAVAQYMCGVLLPLVRTAQGGASSDGRVFNFSAEVWDRLCLDVHPIRRQRSVCAVVLCYMCLTGSGVMFF